MQKLERKLKHTKRTDSLGNVNFNDLCVNPESKFSGKFKSPTFKKYDGKSYPYAHLKVYGVVMT